MLCWAGDGDGTSGTQRTLAYYCYESLDVSSLIFQTLTLDRWSCFFSLTNVASLVLREL